MITGTLQCRYILAVVILVLNAHCNDELPPPCNSEIYCYGRLLHVIQMAKLFEDSKTFVDMKMKYSINTTLHNFDTFMIEVDHAPKRKDVRNFLKNNFEREGQEFEPWIPNDWKTYPKFIDNIKDPLYKTWASDLNAIWKELGRKLKPEIEANQEHYSIVWVPNPVIVPGGRFREFYYWDSYWIIQGLLLSEMFHTARGMLDNFLYIVDTYGLIPNGGRIYYLERSQPPLLIPMVKLYVDAANDMKYVAENIDTMENELNFWLVNRTRTIIYNGKTYTLAAYGDKSRGPRPESYSEDIHQASIFPAENQKEKFYSELKAAAESGWDFSSRWFITNATNNGNLSNLNTRYIIPTDLNAIIYWNAIILSEFHLYLKNFDKVRKYQDIAEQWKEAVTAVLWHEDVGAWLDYDSLNSISRNYFYPTNIAPLWTNCYPKEDKQKIVKLVLKYLQNMDIVYPGGVPTTKERTGEQWDYPNAWPPLQHMMVVGLYSTGSKTAQRLALEICEKWVLSNYKAYSQAKAMFEKYDATRTGGFGGGGEYEVQKGFGWTNGVIMDLLNRYGQLLRSDRLMLVQDPQPILSKSGSIYKTLSTGLLVLVLSIGAGFIGVEIYQQISLRRRMGLSSRLSAALSTEYTELRNISNNRTMM